MQHFFCLKKLNLYKEFFCLKKYFIVKFTMAGASNQNILNFIKKKLTMILKKNLLVFFPQIL